MIEPPVSTQNTDAGALHHEAKARIEAVAREFAGQFVYLSAHDPESDRKLAHIAAIGQDAMHALSDLAQKAMARGGARDGQVSAAQSHLHALRLVMEHLNPGADDTALTGRKRFGLFPAKKRQISYFHRYETAQGSIDAALSGLMQSRDFLLHDNIVVGRLRKLAPPLLAQLAEAIYLCQCLDQRFEKLADQLAKSDPAKADYVRQSGLFTARQRHMDLVTHAAVAQQTVATLAIITHNNTELAKGIDRAAATTTAALQTAIVAAQTLANHHIVLDQVIGVTGAAANMAEGASTRPVPDDMAAAAQVAALRNALAKVTASVTDLETQAASEKRA